MKLDKGMLSLIRSNNANKAYGDEFSPIPCGPVIELLLKEIEQLTKPTFGQQLRELREAKGLKIVELAALSHVSQPYISQVESGNRRVPSPDILRKLAKALDTPFLELMDLAGHLEELEEDDPNQGVLNVGIGD